MFNLLVQNTKVQRKIESSKKKLKKSFVNKYMLKAF